MKVTFIIRRAQKGVRKKAIDWDDKEPIICRVADKGIVDQKAIIHIRVPAGAWDNENSTIDSRIVCDKDWKISVLSEIAKIEEYVRERYNEIPMPVPQKWLRGVLDDYYAAVVDENEVKPLDFEEVFDAFLKQHTVSSDSGQRKLSDSRRRQYLVIKRMIQRYEMYVREKTKRKYDFDVRAITAEDLKKIYDYISHESDIVEHMLQLLEAFPEKCRPKERCINTMADKFKKIRCFFNWCVDAGYVVKSPFDNFKIDAEVYGSIYFLEWPSEIKKIAGLDLTNNPKLENVRDLMLLQAGVGCRVGDLMKLKKTNVYGGFVHYIPRKTMAENPETVTVPIFDFVQEVIDRYKGDGSPYLVPPMNPQDYNENMRLILTMARITRNVTYLDPQTRTEVTAPINKVFSSHDLRRTFTNAIFQLTGGNTALTSSYTGHKTERAFQRYREISDKMKMDTVRALNLNKK